MAHCSGNFSQSMAQQPSAVIPAPSATSSAANETSPSSTAGIHPRTCIPSVPAPVNPIHEEGRSLTFPAPVRKRPNATSPRSADAETGAGTHPLAAAPRYSSSTMTRRCARSSSPLVTVIIRVSCTGPATSCGGTAYRNTRTSSPAE